MSDPSDLSWWFGGQQYTVPKGTTQLGPQAQTSANAATTGLGQLSGSLGPVSTNQVNPVAGAQGTLASQLGAIGSGVAPGAGELAVQRQVANAEAAQTSAANSARGMNAGTAGLTAARNDANLGIAGAGEAQQAALQDQMNALGLQATVLNQQGQLDLNATAQKLQAQGMNQQQIIAYMSQLTGQSEAELAAQMQAQAIQAGSVNQGMIGQVLSSAGGLATAAGALGYKPLGGGGAPQGGGGTVNQYLPPGYQGIG